MTPADAALPLSSYAEGIAIFVLGIGAFIGVCWLIDRSVGLYLRRHVTAALGPERRDLDVCLAEIEDYANSEVDW